MEPLLFLSLSFLLQDDSLGLVALWQPSWSCLFCHSLDRGECFSWSHLSFHSLEVGESFDFHKGLLVLVESGPEVKTSLSPCCCACWTSHL